MITRQRIRELGISPGILPAGKWNAITDVAGVKVGHVTLIEGDDVRTGVTAILPHGENIFQEMHFNFCHFYILFCRRLFLYFLTAEN